MKLKNLVLFPTILLLACTSEKQSQETATAEKQIHGEEVVYTANGDTLKGYLAYDASTQDKRPGVLVVHEWWGHNEYARDRARMLAELGYTALAVDMYGNGKQANHPDDAGKFAKEVMQNLDVAVKRFNAARELLQNHPTTDPQSTAAIGYCFGGGVVLHMARIGADLDGVVSFHGSLGSMHKPEPGTIKAKILVGHGADDPFVPPDQVEAFKKEMDEAGADYTFIAYEGAKHSFTNPDADKFGAQFNLPLAYNEAVDQKSWQDMQDFFNKLWSGVQ
ncbi:MAG TPA: dienelactone hydrolase family protein [bacterium]